MKTIIFIAITLLAGAIAGTILGAINQVAVEPYIDHAVELEMQNTNQSSQIINPAEFTAYRLWQRGGEIVASIMWFVLFLMPALKYPANPHAVGDPETIYY
jgi:hypothetical protein